ncbi:hypothetical protein chiPu_0022567 [Chiloscyllium punctatum]|uniref:Uncharacterized protein n=1 Tax=Chiloscyllium punctatum TaxID=137246 RepID=A0A401RDX7_CHIPU|nr:hypothetical protein [Chiloscyllium punctatum]
MSPIGRPINAPGTGHVTPVQLPESAKGRETLQEEEQEQARELPEAEGHPPHGQRAQEEATPGKDPRQDGAETVLYLPRQQLHRNDDVESSTV